MPATADSSTDYRVREALAAHARGWLMTPLDGKKPTDNKWQLAPVPSEEQVERWATLGNVGLRTGRNSGVVVIDVDSAKGGRIDNLPETPTVLTGGGGMHYYFRAPSLPLRNSAGRLAPHVDFRAEGGQVVFPGSKRSAMGPFGGLKPPNHVPRTSVLPVRSVTEACVHRGADIFPAVGTSVCATGS